MGKSAIRNVCKVSLDKPAAEQANLHVSRTREQVKLGSLVPDLIATEVIYDYGYSIETLSRSETTRPRSGGGTSRNILLSLLQGVSPRTPASLRSRWIAREFGVLF